LTEADELDGALRSAARGDEKSMERLVRALAPDVHRFFVGLFGPGPVADEALQETFVRVARALDRNQDTPAAASFVLGIARRVASDLTAPVASRRGISATVEWPAGAIPSLAAEQREALVLREVVRWDVPEIARVLGVSTDDVCARLVAARRSLSGSAPTPS
jgi:RNA polymerase sigma-70 factor (ECF subfamily)